MIEDFINHTDIRQSYRFCQQIGQQNSIEIEEHLQKLFELFTFNRVRKLPLKQLISSFNFTQVTFKPKRFKKLQELVLNTILQHPNIIQIYEVFECEYYVYIVMEYMEGGELCEKRNLHRCQNQRQICDIVKTITDALDFCHSHNIVHRDIKPQNILWSTKDQHAILKIADFGFAKMVNENLMTTACGTPLFFSPEILYGKPYSNAVDYWSLGVVTYILLSGKPPFEAQTEEELYQAIKRGKIQFPERQWIYISFSAKDFILRLLQKNQSKRYNANKIRSHAWMTSEHSVQRLYKERYENIKMFGTIRKVNKMQFLIQQTISELGGQKSRS